MRPQYFQCGTEATLAVIGGKWKLLILWHLQEAGVIRFNELKRGMSGITQRVLTQQLRELEADGIVQRRIYAQVPPKVEYSLTAFGKTLNPLLDSMCEWGEAYQRRQARLGAKAMPESQKPELEPAH